MAGTSPAMTFLKLDRDTPAVTSRRPQLNFTSGTVIFSCGMEKVSIGFDP